MTDSDEPENTYAFPLVSEEERIRENGMTLRDYFAGQALQGIIASGNLIMRDLDSKEDVLECVSDGAYKYADAMLSQREDGGEND